MSRANPAAAALSAALGFTLGLSAAWLVPDTASAVAARAWKPAFSKASVARVVVPTSARALPGAGATRLRLRTKSAWTGGSVGLLVLDGRDDAAGRLWLRVRLPSRPNDASGWVNADHVVVATTPWRVVVRIASRRVSVYRSGTLVRSFGAVVGTKATPTPTGLFALSETDRQPDGGGFLGPWALHLTAHSDVLTNYGGGAGRVAIHGRGGASLADPLGTARSHGCVRIDNAEVSWLARRLRAGTPVRITR